MSMLFHSFFLVPVILDLHHGAVNVKVMYSVDRFPSKYSANFNLTIRNWAKEHVILL